MLPKLRAATFPGSEPAPRCMGAPKLHGAGPTPGHGAGFWKQGAGPGLCYAVQLLGWLAGYPPGLSVFNGLSWGLVSCKRQRSTKSNDSWCLGSSFYILFIYLYTCHCFTSLSLFMHMQPDPNGELSSELQFSLQSFFVQPQLKQHKVQQQGGQSIYAHISFLSESMIRLSTWLIASINATY